MIWGIDTCACAWYIQVGRHSLCKGTGVYTRPLANLPASPSGAPNKRTRHSKKAQKIKRKKNIYGTVAGA